MKSLQIHSGQKLVQTQTCNEHKVFLEALICAASWELPAALVLDKQHAVCTPHASMSHPTNEKCPMRPGSESTKRPMVCYELQCLHYIKVFLCHRNNDLILRNKDFYRISYCHSLKIFRLKKLQFESLA